MKVIPKIKVISHQWDSRGTIADKANNFLKDIPLESIIKVTHTQWEHWENITIFYKEPEDVNKIKLSSLITNIASIGNNKVYGFDVITDSNGTVRIVDYRYHPVDNHRTITNLSAIIKISNFISEHGDMYLGHDKVEVILRDGIIYIKAD